MNCKIPETSEDAILQVEEPSVAYAVRGRAAKLEPWAVAGGVDEDYDADDDDDGVEDVCKVFGVDGPVVGSWFDHLYKKSSEFRTVFERMMEESEADIKAGRTYSHEEVWAELEQEYPQWYGIK